LKGEAVTITDTNFNGLQQLCEEFAFDDLAAKRSNFQPSIGSKEAEARGRIAAIYQSLPSVISDFIGKEFGPN
jgi:hypothetical protein